MTVKRTMRGWTFEVTHEGKLFGLDFFFNGKDLALSRSEFIDKILEPATFFLNGKIEGWPQYPVESSDVYDELMDAGALNA